MKKYEILFRYGMNILQYWVQNSIFKNERHKKAGWLYEKRNETV